MAGVVGLGTKWWREVLSGGSVGIIGCMYLQVVAGEVRDEACEGRVWWQDNDSDCIWWQLADCQFSNRRQGVWIIECM